MACGLLASEANVDSYRIRIGLLSNDEESRLLDAIGVLSDLPVYIDDTADTDHRGTCAARRAVFRQREALTSLSSTTCS